MVPKVPELYLHPPGRRQIVMPKNTLTNYSNNSRGGWGHQLRWGEREVRIMIMFQNMRVMVNESDQSSQHKLDTLKKTMINEGISIIGLAEVNSNWSKIPIRENIYNRTEGWFKTRSISTIYNRVAISGGTFQSGGTAIMAVDGVSCRSIGTGQEFRNLGCWPWMLLQGNKNMRTRIITAYCPTASASSGGAYSQQIEALAIMKLQNDPRTQFWIDLNKLISKWIHQGEKIIRMG